MKLTRIRNKDGQKINHVVLNIIANEITVRLAKKGFITDFSVTNSSSIKLGLHMKSFVVDVNKLGYNAVMGEYVKTKKGYKRTNIPTWEQREDYNHIVNDVLDKYKISCNIKSGPYVIRSINTGRVDSWNCVDYAGNPAEANKQYNGLGQLCAEIMSEKEAMVLCE